MALPDPIDLGDLGSVALVAQLGDDLTVVNAARASYARSCDTLGERELRLLAYLAENGHDSPFRHAVLALQIDAPLMVARQWFKYRVGSTHSPDLAEVDLPIVARLDGQGDDGSDDPLHARNEASRRYVRDRLEFYIPDLDQWRRAPKSGKQGSGDEIDNPEGQGWTQLLRWHVDVAVRGYQRAIDAGVAPELARLFLPAYALRTSWRWTASLQAVAHFVRQRTHPHAQAEIRRFGHAVDQLARFAYPHAYGALIGREADRERE